MESNILRIALLTSNIMISEKYRLMNYQSRPKISRGK